MLLQIDDLRLQDSILRAQVRLNLALLFHRTVTCYILVQLYFFQGALVARGLGLGLGFLLTFRLDGNVQLRAGVSREQGRAPHRSDANRHRRSGK